MKKHLSTLAAALPLALAAVGCGTLEPFEVAIDSDPPGMHIEVNHDYAGKTPTTYTMYGNEDRTFHGDWADDLMVTVVATPPADRPELFVQKKHFNTSGFFEDGNRIPERIFFDMHRPASPDGGIQIQVNP